MNLAHNKSVTLLELLIAITLISLVVLGLSSIDLFSRYHLLTSDRRAKLQNEVSYILEHMTKRISSAIGNEKLYGANSIVSIANNRINIYIDANQDSQRQDPINNPSVTDDYWVAYDYTPSNNRIRYCGRCSYSTGCGDCAVNVTALATHIINFSPTANRDPADNTLRDNFMDISITACWDPDGSPVPCDTPANPNPDNPAVTMGTRIKMPLVSTN